jgi:hypothetical protein
VFQAKLRAEIVPAIQSAGLGERFSIGVPPNTNDLGILAAWAVAEFRRNDFDAKLGGVVGEVIVQADYTRIPGVKVLLRVQVLKFIMGDITASVRYHEKGGQYSYEAELQLQRLLGR